MIETLFDFTMHFIIYISNPNIFLGNITKFYCKYFGMLLISE